MQYLTEIRQIVSEYDKLNAATAELEKMTNLLKERQLEIESAIEANRQREKALIDKIVAETGEQPDYHKIMQLLNEPA